MPMNGSATPHLLVVDDDQRLRSLLQRYLAANGFRVSVAADAAQARMLMRSIEFDGMVLDVMMPGESGLDLAADLRNGYDLPILMLTARSETGDRIAGLERGVDDYLAKPFEPRELMLRLNAMLRRVRLAQPPANREIRMGHCIFDAERGELTRSGKHVKLTGAEQLLMKLLAANAGRPFTRALLCQRLNLQLERSVDVQVTRLRRKIEDDPRVPLYIQTVRGTGYVLVPDRVR
jgi:two-component system, OmpR family, phosphate regulon response regulator OmpR